MNPSLGVHQSAPSPHHLHLNSHPRPLQSVKIPLRRHCTRRQYPSTHLPRHRLGIKQYRERRMREQDPRQRVAVLLAPKRHMRTALFAVSVRDAAPLCTVLSRLTVKVSVSRIQKGGGNSRTREPGHRRAE